MKSQISAIEYSKVIFFFLLATEYNGIDMHDRAYLNWGSSGTL